MFPAVAFRPVRLLVISAVFTGLAMLAAGLAGHLMVGVFFGVGLLLGLLNALLVRRSVESITADEHPLKRSMALNSASRLAIITVVGLIIAYLFKPDGAGRGFRTGALPGAPGGVDGFAGLEEAAHGTTGAHDLKRRRTQGTGGSSSSDD